jgi:hypothetical protein
MVTRAGTGTAEVDATLGVYAEPHAGPQTQPNSRKSVRQNELSFPYHSAGASQSVRSRPSRGGGWAHLHRLP